MSGNCSVENPGNQKKFLQLQQVVSISTAADIHAESNFSINVWISMFPF